MNSMNPGHFGPIPLQSDCFGPSRFGPISWASPFGPFGMGRFRPISQVGRFDQIFGMGRFGLKTGKITWLSSP